MKILSDGVARALASKDVVDALANPGVEPNYGSPVELDASLKAEAAMWSRLLREAGVKPQQ